MKLFCCLFFFTSLLAAQSLSKIILLNQMVYKGEIKEVYPHAIKLDEENDNQYIMYSVISTIITDSVQAMRIKESNSSIVLSFADPDYILSFTGYKPSKEPIVKKSDFQSSHQISIYYSFEFNPHKRLVELQNEQFGRIYNANAGIEYCYKINNSMMAGLGFDYAQYSTSLDVRSSWRSGEAEFENNLFFLSANLRKTLLSILPFEILVITKAGIIFSNQKYTSLPINIYHSTEDMPPDYEGTGFSAEIVPLFNYNLGLFAINTGLVFRWSSISYQDNSSNISSENSKQYYTYNLRFGVGYRL